MSNDSSDDGILDAIVFDETNSQKQILAIILATLMVSAVVLYFATDSDNSSLLFFGEEEENRSDIFVTGPDGYPVDIEPIDMSFIASDVG